MKSIIQKAIIKAKIFKDKAMFVLHDNSGQGTIEQAIQILVAVVLGALILAGLYALMGDTILPTLQERLEEMFDYSG